MNKFFHDNKFFHLSRITLFACLVTVIVLMFPRENKFNYHFEVGKPWAYELITASFDFPIYKTKELVTEEQRLAFRDYKPYYKFDNNVLTTSLNNIISAYRKKNGRNSSVEAYLKKKMSVIYEVGVISMEEHSKLLKDSIKSIFCILPSKITNVRDAKTLYTPLTAYEEIKKDAPNQLLLDDLNKYIVENVIFDTTKSELAKKEITKNLSLTSGMIQTGERVIDRGEIVTHESYNLLNSMKIESEKRLTTFQKSTLVIIGEIVITIGLIVLFFLYLILFRPRLYNNISNLIFILLLIFMVVGMTALAIRINTLNYLMVPFALIPIIIRVFFDSRTALFAHIITSLIISFMVPNPFQFVILQISIGMIAVSSLKDLSQRSQLLQTAFYIFIGYLLVFISLQFISEGDIRRIDWDPIFYFAISSICLLLAYILIYFFEKIFNLISSVTLIELTNINSDLLMEFSERAPGTFQHSLQVSNLATEAAKKINANSLLVRTGALYHDIGKMKHPEYFIENQLKGKNLLLDMDFEEASKIVINHVTDGVEIAKANHLPEQVINFIGTHHGCSKTKYFYNSYINAHPDQKPEDAVFTYPGPLPNSKESAILMMADGVEARCRSLTNFSEDCINNMVECMINDQIADGQFKNSPITFQDVETVKAVFKSKLISLYHSRIAYPELKENQDH